jgi:hypothetical protein
MRLLRAGLACALAGAAVAAPAFAAPRPVVYGRVLDDLGRPVRGATVTVAGKTDAYGFPLGGAPAPTASARTDAAGRYRVTMPATLVARTGEKALTITEPGSGALPGAVTRTDIYWAQQDLRVTDLRLWHAGPSVTAVGPLLRVVRRDPLPEAFGRAQDDIPDVVLLQDGAHVWTYADADGDHYADARTVETGVNGVAEVETAMVGHGYKVTYRSRALPVAGGVTPVSRGASCAAYGQADALIALPGCLFTDGRLGWRVPTSYALAGNKACLYPSGSCPHPRWVRLDLGAPALVQAAVVRCAIKSTGPAETLPAEVSLDGTLWAPFLAMNPYSDLEYAPPTPARYVRIDLRSCAAPPPEISVFGPA